MIDIEDKHEGDYQENGEDDESCHEEDDEAIGDKDERRDEEGRNEVVNENVNSKMVMNVHECCKKKKYNNDNKGGK